MNQNAADLIDQSFYFIFGVSALLLFGVTAAMIYFAWKYHRTRNPRPTHIEGNVWLEIIWTVVPTALVMVMFYYGWMGYQVSRDVPPDAFPVTVVGRMWSWAFQYPNGKVSDTLKVPLDKPIKLILTSQDVNHSFYLAAFRVKEDCIPGRENYMWFRPTKIQTYDIQCAEYCGTDHSQMRSTVIVMPPDEWLTWYNTVEVIDENSGQRLIQMYGCLSCHTTDGSARIGPSLKGIWGEETTVLVRRREEKVEVDEDYIRESMLDPNAKVVKGYPPNQMPSQEGILSDEQINAIINYIKEIE